MSQTITIPTTSTTTVSSSKPYTVYNLHLKSALRTSVIQKRYSDFDTLHSALTSEAGAAPPHALPGKSWFSRTINNEKLTEERRVGLESYVKAIVEGSDAKWRKTRAWRGFVGDKSADDEDGGLDGGKGSGVKGLNRNAITSAAQWLDVHRDLKGKLHEARLALNRREQAQNPTSQHEAAATAKQSLVRAGTLIALLDQGLERLRSGGGGGGDGWGGGERLGDGEVRRRRDLLSTARKEREGLEAVLNSLAIATAVKSVGMGGDGERAAGQMSEDGLFSHPNHSTATTMTTGSTATTGSSRRVIGAPLQETERTRELENEGVLQLQRQIMQEQDMDVQDLTKVVKRMREMGVAINEEVVEQNVLLGLLDQDVDRVQGKIDVAKKRIGKIH